jgi:hypothetical protein
VETWLSGFDAGLKHAAVTPIIKFANELVSQTVGGRFLLK